MSADIALLVNPSAGRGSAEAAATIAADVLRRRHFDVEMIRAGSIAETTSTISGAIGRGIGTIVVCGGDGTVNLALQLLAETDGVLGVIPAGSGNDFARSLSLPLTDPQAAAAIIAAGHSQLIDLGRVGERWFGTVLAAGFDARVNARANRMRWPRGPVKFKLATLGELASFRPIHFELEMDGSSVELDGMLVAVGNGQSYGSGMRICPDADLSDGLLDITVVADLSRTALIKLFRHVYPGTHVGLHQVSTFRARQLSLKASGVIAYADGEYAANAPLLVTSVPGALRVLTPIALPATARSSDT